MRRVSWNLVYVVIFIVVFGGVSYGVYNYFFTFSSSKVSQEKTPVEINNEYLDTLVLDIQKDLASIKVEVADLSKATRVAATVFAVFSVLVILNLVLLVLLCFAFMSLKNNMTKQLGHSLSSEAK